MVVEEVICWFIVFFDFVSHRFLRNDMNSEKNKSNMQRYFLRLGLTERKDETRDRGQRDRRQRRREQKYFFCIFYNTGSSRVVYMVYYILIIKIIYTNNRYFLLLRWLSLICYYILIQLLI
jgi:hypothetical protein